MIDRSWIDGGRAALHPRSRRSVGPVSRGVGECRDAARTRVAEAAVMARSVDSGDGGGSGPSGVRLGVDARDLWGAHSYSTHNWCEIGFRTP